MMKTLTFLKLGGSLITDKSKPATAWRERISQLAAEIAAFREAEPEVQVLLGHGSGSFGHVPAAKFGTRQGVSGEAEWQGFVQVWKQAAALNQIVMEVLQAAGLLAMPFPPSASAIARDGQIAAWDVTAIRAALKAGLLPVVYGDVAFDEGRGGTILSTEDLFVYLAEFLGPDRILLAANEAVYRDYPARKEVVKEITVSNFAELSAALGGSEAEDVTGGMLGKVERMLDLVERRPDTEVRIFAGVKEGALRNALQGSEAGTRIGFGPE